MELSRRRMKGALGSLVAVLLVSFLIVLGAVTIDISHYVLVQKELQCAVDSGALAGAAQMSKNSNAAVTNALNVAAKNTVEGSALSNDTPRTIVSVETSPSSETAPGTLTVIGRREIAFLFGNWQSSRRYSLSAAATAGPNQISTRIPAGITFPLAISVDAVPTDEPDWSQIPLHQLRPGDTFTIYLGSAGKKNAAFTSLSDQPANNNLFKAVIDESLNLVPPGDAPQVPSSEVGMPIYLSDVSLSNGESAFNYLQHSSASSAMLAEPYIVFPLIEGDPSYNQTRPIIGFVALKITRITKQKGVPAIEGRIVKPAMRGQTTQKYSGAYATSVTELSPLVVRLIR